MWWLAVVGLLLLAHAKIETFYYLLQESPLSGWMDPSLVDSKRLLLDRLITPFRGLVLLIGGFVVAAPVVQDVVSASRQAFQGRSRALWLQSGLAFLVLCVLISPGQLYGLAQEYTNSSLTFFTKATTLNLHQRYLMPALANLLFLRGDLGFLAFSLLLALLLVFLVRAWFHLNAIPIPLWQLISLGTSSFIYFQFSAPGYPDVLVAIFMLVAFGFAPSRRARLSLFVLSLAAHEASLILWAAIAWMLFDRRGWTQLLLIGGLYITVWALTDGGVLAILDARSNAGMSNLRWVLLKPGLELLGIFFAFKGLWALVLAALWQLALQRKWIEFGQIAAVLVGGLIMTFLGLDTSRLFGMAFVAVLVSWRLLASLQSAAWKRFIAVVLAINLLIPPVYTQLNLPLTVRPGLYRIIVDSLAALFVQ